MESTFPLHASRPNNSRGEAKVRPITGAYTAPAAAVLAPVSILALVLVSVARAVPAIDSVADLVILQMALTLGQLTLPPRVLAASSAAAAAFAALADATAPAPDHSDR